jgi:hypothetical protein
MAKVAEKCRVRTAINDNGDIVLYGSELGDIITEGGADSLIGMISTAKSDSKEIKTALKRIASIKKQYNSIGKPLEHDNLKVLAEGALTPEGVIDDEAA